MIEFTAEMRAAAERRMGADLDPWTVAAIKDVLAIYARGRCLAPAGHVYHPLAKPKSGRGVLHPHYCLSCSDGEGKGAGCGNCRQTGFDQSPWPDCAGCAR